MSWTKLLFLFFVLRSALFPRKFPISYLRFVNFNSNAPEMVPSSVCAYYFCSRAFWGSNKKKDIKQEEGQRDMFHVLLSTTLLNQNETNLWFESFRALERSSNWPQYALHETVGRATEPPEGDWSKYGLQSEQQLMSSNRLEWKFRTMEEMTLSAIAICLTRECLEDFCECYCCISPSANI